MAERKSFTDSNGIERCDEDCPVLIRSIGRHHCILLNGDAVDTCGGVCEAWLRERVKAQWVFEPTDLPSARERREAWDRYIASADDEGGQVVDFADFATYCAKIADAKLAERDKRDKRFPSQTPNKED